MRRVLIIPVIVSLFCLAIVPVASFAQFTISGKVLRSTIYWKPELATDKDGKASFDFYNADGTGTYRVTIEGIDEKGNLGRQTFTYKVQ